MFLKAKFLVNNEPVDISGFSFKTPPNVMGQSVTLALSYPDINAIPGDATIVFYLGAGIPPGGEGDFSYVKLLEAGRVTGQNNAINWIPDDNGGKPGDIVEIDLLSPLGEKWSLCPPAPITMFDPTKVNIANFNPNPDSLPRLIRPDLSYSLIYPVFEPVAAFSLWKMLDRAYTNKRPVLAYEANTLGTILGRNVYEASNAVGVGIGFDRVITNIPDIPLEQVTFGYEGWNAGASPSLVNYEPEVFEVDNVLYIICPFLPLPPGLPVKVLSLRCIISVNHTKQPVELTNAAFMSYKLSNGNSSIFAGAIPSIKFVNDEPRLSGQGDSFTRTEVERRIVEYIDLTTKQVVHTEETDITTRTYAFRPNVTVASNADGKWERTVNGGSVQLISEEVLENSYEGKTKSGFTRTTKALYSDPNQAGAPDKYGDVKKEVCRQNWITDLNNPGQFILTFCETITSGLCLVEEQEIEFTDTVSNKQWKYINKVYTPILEACNQGLVTGELTQYTEDKTLTTKTEQLRDKGFNQTDVETTVIDNISGVTLLSEIQPRTGSTGTFNPSLPGGGTNGRVITEFLTDADSIAKYGLRKPLRIDIGELNPVDGRKLVYGKLKRLANPPKSVTIELPGVDFSIRRGSIVVPPTRAGSTGINYLVRGSTITGRALGTAQAQISQTLECIELVSYA